MLYGVGLEHGKEPIWKRERQDFRRIVEEAEVRQRHSLDILLTNAQLPRATFYYHLKRINREDKYEAAKAEITAIYHENKGRHGYRCITVSIP